MGRFSFLPLLLSLFFFAGCENELTGVPPSIIVVSQPNSSELTINDIILIEVDYNLPLSEVVSKWYIGTRESPFETLTSEEGKVFKLSVTELDKFVITHVASNSVSKVSIQFEYTVKGPEGGFYILNAHIGVGSEESSIDYIKNTAKDGDGMTVTKGIITNSSQNSNIGDKLIVGKILSEYLYVLSETPPHLTKIHTTNDESFVSGNITSGVSSVIARDIELINSKTAVITSDKGIYLFDLDKMVDLGKIFEPEKKFGNVLFSNNKLFVTSEDKGLEIFDYNGTEFIRDGVNSGFNGGNFGFTETVDGSIWFTTLTKLIKMNPIRFNFESIDLPFVIENRWMNWRNGTIIARPGSNDVFIASIGPDGIGTKVYRYQEGNPTSLDFPFITLDPGHRFVGEAISYDEAEETIVALSENTKDGITYITLYDPLVENKKWKQVETPNAINVHPMAVVYVVQ